MPTEQSPPPDDRHPGTEKRDLHTSVSDSATRPDGLIESLEKHFHELLNEEDNSIDEPEAGVSSAQRGPEGRIGQYCLLEKIGEGAVGEVWRAVDEMLDRQVAIKVLKPGAPRAFGRLIREAKAAARLINPHVVCMHHGIEDDAGGAHIVMELLDHSLEKEIKDGGMGWRAATAAIRDSAMGLAAAHAAGLIHRDIKPSNLLRSSQGVVKVADFGLVHIDDSSSSNQSSHMFGTPAFTSPEQCRDEPVIPQSDIYSLGCTFYALITGRPPFDTQSPLALVRKHCEEDLPDPRTAAPDTPEGVCRIIRRATQKNPSDRYQSAEAMLSDLESVLAGGTRELASRRVIIAYKRNAHPDSEVLAYIESSLLALGHEVFIDRHLAIGVKWATEIERQIRESDAIIPLLSASSVQSEMLAYELEVAHAVASSGSGKPQILPVRVQFDGALPPEMVAVLQPLQYFLWRGNADNASLIEHLVSAMRSPQRRSVDPAKLDAVGGAVTLDSKFYLQRRTDQQFLDAIARRDAIVLVKGARQVGKTSLLARGLALARQSGVQAVACDFQKLTVQQLESPEAFYAALGNLLVDELDLDVRVENKWDSRRAPNINFDRFIRREVLGNLPGPLVWALDEVDRLFGCAFGSEVFALFRTWHNERAMNPSGPWGRLTLAIAYATEAHLFIRDVNQSPFNVGTRLTLQDFTLEQVAELNGRYGTPLVDRTEVARLFKLIGGQPFLVQRGLYDIASQGLSFDELEARAAQEDGPYGDHLRRILVLLSKDPDLLSVMCGVLRGVPCPDAESFYRLRAAGVLKGSSAQDAEPRCQVYHTYLQRHLV